MIGLRQYSQNTFPKLSLLIVHESVIIPHLDYGDILCDQVYNASFQQKVENIKYSAVIAITGGIRATSKEKAFRS